MLALIGLITVCVVLVFAVLLLASHHLLGVKIDNAIAGLETNLKLTAILTKLNLLDVPTPTTSVTPPVVSLEKK